MGGSLLISLFSFSISVMFCQEFNLQKKIRDRVFLCGLQAQLVLMYSVWLFFNHMWVHVYCLDERESWWFSEMPVIILPLLFFYVTCFTREHQKFLSIALASYIPSTYPLPALPLFTSLKVFSHRSFIFYFTFSSSHSHSQLLAFILKKYDFMHCFIGVYYNSITLSLLSFSAPCSCSYSVCPFLPSLPPSFPSSSCPSPSAERWMDGTKWLMNQWMILYCVCVTDRKRERLKGGKCVRIFTICVSVSCVSVYCGSVIQSRMIVSVI